MREKLKGFRFNVGDFVNFAGFVVGGPLAGLLSFVVEVAGAEFASVFSEPFPVAGGKVFGHFALGPDGAVFVVLGVWFFVAGHGRIMRFCLGNAIEVRWRSGIALTPFSVYGFRDDIESAFRWKGNRSGRTGRFAH